MSDLVTPHQPPIPIVEEKEASGEVAEIFAAIKREMQMPFVPNMMKQMAVSPAALSMFWGMNRAFYEHMTMPQSLAAMIGYTVAEHSNCEYCAAGNEMACRTLGIDEETLAGLARDLGKVNPRRVRAIIGFALKVAHNPQGLGHADYDKVRKHGVTDEDIVEIVLITAVAVLADTIADALKIQVEPAITEALGR